MPELPEVETIARALKQECEGLAIEKVLCRRRDLRYPLPKGFADIIAGRKVVKVERRAKYIIISLASELTPFHLSLEGRSRIAVAPKERRRTGEGGVKKNTPHPASAKARLAASPSLRIPLPQGERGSFADCEAITLILHLGMSGRVLIHAKPPVKYDKHDHVIFFFRGGKTMVFNDARRFGMMDVCPADAVENHKFFKALGPEPLNRDFSSTTLCAALRRRKSSIKAALMDQRVAAGLGNIYVCEALFRSSISPRKTAAAITKEQTHTLIKNIREVLSDAIASGGSTLRDYVRSNGDIGYFQHHFKVYGREAEPCFTCGTPIKRIMQQRRSTFYCPQCQR